MGHLNTRHYVAMFDDASAHYLSAIGYSPNDIEERQIGWADVKCEIEYKSEVPLGGQVTIDSRTERVGTKSLTMYSEMRHVPGGELSATMRSVIVHFDLKARRAVAIPDHYRNKAEAIGVKKNE